MKPKPVNTAETAATACGSFDPAGRHAGTGDPAPPVRAGASLLVATASLFTWTP